ncbi:MAG: rubrerythrin family protein, partial [Pseudoflavonifractor sp.]
MAEDAKEEGFTALAAQFAGVAKIEKEHEERYLAFLKNLDEGMVFQRGEEYVWKCRNFGHILVGKEATKVCPVCAHPQAYFELQAKNY